MTKGQKETLRRACFTVKHGQPRRRRVLLRLAQKHLPKEPWFAYYLALGTVPKSLSVYED